MVKNTFNFNLRGLKGDLDLGISKIELVIIISIWGENISFKSYYIHIFPKSCVRIMHGILLIVFIHSLNPFVYARSRIVPLTVYLYSNECQ